MRHAVIIAHPNAESFTHSVARAYGATITAQGDEPVEVRAVVAQAFPRVGVAA